MHRRRQVENRRDAQLTPAVEAEGVQGVPCARFPPRTRHAPLVFVDASIVFVDDGSVESHLNRRYLISATPHWTIYLALSYADAVNSLMEIPIFMDTRFTTLTNRFRSRGFGSFEYRPAISIFGAR